MNLIKELINLPKCGIWVLVNDRTKKVIVRETDNIVESFMRIYHQLKDRAYSSDAIMGDMDNLEFKVLDPEINIVWRLFFYNAIRKRYKEEGYEICADYSAISIFITKHLTTTDDTTGHPAYMKWQVNLRTKYFNETVGLFDNEYDANEFIKQYYSSKPDTNLVYAITPSTKNMLVHLNARQREIDTTLGLK